MAVGLSATYRFFIVGQSILVTGFYFYFVTISFISSK